MKKYIKIIFSLFILTILFFSNNVSAYASSGSDNSGGSSKFIIEKYHVDINVDEKNFLHISEAIKVNFLDYQHGIYRFIPYRYFNNIGENQDYSKLFIKVENISVAGEKVKISHDESYGYKFVNLRIGDSNSYVIGEREYSIKYVYKIGRISGNQYIYYNIMGNMNTPIKNSSFTITLPKKVSAADIKFYQGAVGSEVSSNLTYATEELKDGRFVISGSLNTSLGSDEYLTVFIPVSNTYFAKATVLKSNLQMFMPVLLVLSVLNAIVAFILWFFFGRDKKIIRLLEYKPPKNLTPLEIYFIYNEISNVIFTNSGIKEASSLLYYLANKGYIAIEFLKEDEFTIKNLKKEIDDEKNHIKQFYNGLFKNGDELTKKDLGKVFYEAGQAAVINVETAPQTDGITLLYRSLIIIFSLGLEALAVFLSLDHLDILGFVMVAALIAAWTIINLVLSFNLEKSTSGIKKNKGVLMIGEILVYIVFIGMIFLVSQNILLAILVLILEITITFSFFIKKRTNEYIAMLGRIEGFKKFIKIAKKNEIEMLIKENPNYFFDILPYAHILGVSKVFIGKFKDVDVNIPENYSGPGLNTFSYIFLYNYLYRMDSIAHKSYLNAMQASKVSFGGGGFSGGGGGFSGGGFGGGGGGSW